MKKITSMEALGRYLVVRYGATPQETCWIIAVDTQLSIIDEVLVAKGTLNQVGIHPRDVFRHLTAVNAYGFMMIHNHPSGHLDASAADLQVLRQFMVCSELMAIKFFDFLIIAANGYRSYRFSSHWKKIHLQSLLDNLD
ncbi:JAB domain-containing protein [Weissella minor]|uniref:Dna repair protein radc n=1 Tax=Weissella minor TaxID=1620 RepID=A0A0R2JFW1_9LACO|nr:JAB domain-containing protein [Weissella minor]KRN76243.1 dna repair protein radc [Weissella minor]